MRSREKWAQPSEKQAENMKRSEYKEESDEEYSFREETRTFTTEISVVGARYIGLKDANAIRRAIWAILVIGGLAFATYQIVGQIRYFISDPTSVDIAVNDEEFIPFPTVTVCNENLMSAAKVYQEDPSGDLAQAITTAFPPLIEAVELSEISGAVDIFRNLNVTDWRAEYQKLYVDIEGQLSLCKFNGADCDPQYMTTVIRELGRCLQFNPYGNLTLREAGAGAGLKMYFNSQQQDYILTTTPTAGYRVLMHDHSEPALMNLWGFNANVNQFSNMQISYKRFKSLPEPFGNCTPTADYRFNDCAQSCLKEYLYRQCNCAHDYMEAAAACSPAEQITCVHFAEQRYITDAILSTECDCKPQCEETTYPFTVTSGDFSQFFVNWLSPIVNSSAADIRRDYAVFSIYFSRIESEFVETKKAYTMMTLLCDIGGALGLIVGSTVLTALELGDFLLVSLWNCARRKNKVKNGKA